LDAFSEAQRVLVELDELLRVVEPAGFELQLGDEVG